MRSFPAILLAITACAAPRAATTAPDAGDPPPDARDAADGALTDAAPPADAATADGPRAHAAIEIAASGGSALTAWDFGLQEDGSASPALALTVTNNTDQTSGVLAVQTAPEFPLDAPISSCAANIELAPGAECSIFVRFDPNAVGPQAGELVVDAGPAVGSAELALAGSGVAAPDLDTSPPFFDFGIVEFGTTVQQTMQVVNSGDDLAITSIAITNPIGGGFSVVSTTCGGDLLAGSACDIVAAFTPIAFGQNGGALAVQTDHGPYMVGTNWLEGYGGARLTVTKTGSGASAADVTSDGGGNPDIDCGTTCSGLFSDGPGHTLTESTAGAFGGWGGAGAACGSASTCPVTLSTSGPTVVQAAFP